MLSCKVRGIYCVASGKNYFQRQWSHALKAKGDKMMSLITYLRTMNVEDKVNTRLDVIARDGSPGHIHIINYFTNYRDEIFQYMQSSNWM